MFLLSSKRVRSLAPFCALFALSVLPAAAQGSLPQFVVVGDSLAAGFQNFSLLASQQTNSAPALLARQAGSSLDLPLVPCPGIPNVLQLVAPGLPPVIAPLQAPPVGPPFRVNPTVQATNLAVPGQTLWEAVAKRPTLTPASAIDLLTNVILGIPGGPVPRSQMEWAIQLNPQNLLLWVGNNDALTAALTGDMSLLTDVNTFAGQYSQLSRTLASTRAKMTFVNIPDVTVAPYFTSIETLATQTGAPRFLLMGALGLGPGDLLRPGALPIAQQILTGQRPGPLPTMCPGNIAGLPVTEVPCVLRLSDALRIRATILGYNLVIAARAIEARGAYVNLAQVVRDMARDGYKIGNRTLTVDFLGGLFSLDGVHPTNAGHAIIANEIMEQMKRTHGINLPKVNVGQAPPDNFTTACRQ